MSRKLPSLNALKTFEAAARNLSFKKAADELFVTQSAVSRQVKALEDHLGVVLFIRSTRAVKLSSDGVTLLEPVRIALDQIEQAANRVMSRNSGGILTVSTLPTFAMRWLVPRLVSFSQRHPHIEVQMVSTIRPVDFARDDIDVGIRVGQPSDVEHDNSRPRISLRMVENWAGVRAQKFASDDLVAVCTPKLLSEGRPLQTVVELYQFPLLHTATRPNAWHDYLHAIGWALPEPHQGISFGHFFMALEAASHGEGIAVIPRILAGPDLTSGNLAVAIDQRVRSSGAYYFLSRHHQWDVPKVKAFREWLITEANRN